MANYLDTKVLERLIAKYKRKKSTAMPELGEAFFRLSQGVAHKLKLKDDAFDQQVQEGALHCLRKVRRYRPALGKAFNYFTSICMNAFFQDWRREKNHKEKVIRLKARLLASRGSNDRQQVRVTKGDS